MPAKPSISKTVGERRTVEYQTTGEEREDNENPEEHGEGSAAAQPGPAGRTRWEPGAPKEPSDEPPSRRQADPAGMIRDDHEERPTGSSGMRTPAAKSPAEERLSLQGEPLPMDHDKAAKERDETGAAASSLRLETEPVDAAMPDQVVEPDLTRETTRGRPFSRVAVREERGRASDPPVSLTRRQETVSHTAPPRGREPAKESTSPTVRVTIGRVEVRAIPPQPVVQPPPAPRPELSLEDYLRQRGGVGR